MPIVTTEGSRMAGSYKSICENDFTLLKLSLSLNSLAIDESDKYHTEQAERILMNVSPPAAFLMWSA